MDPSVASFEDATRKLGRTRANRLLFSWLSDDRLRERLYADMIRRQAILKFESRALLAEDGTDGAGENHAKTFRQKAYLVVHPEHVDQAYREASSAQIGQQAWGHTPYKELGGTFMLAIDEPARCQGKQTDPFQSHDRQRAYCYDLLNRLEPWFDAVATVAFKAGAMLPLKQRSFELADLAETVAAHYVALLFGFSQADLPMLKRTAQAIGDGLMHVNVGRHFLTDPAVIPSAKKALAELAASSARLIDLYDQPIGKDQEDSRKDLCEEFDKLRKYWFDRGNGDPGTKTQDLKNFVPLMRLMAHDDGEFSTTEKALLVAGLVSGTITNMRAAVCIVIRQFFELEQSELESVRAKAVDAWQSSRDANWNGSESMRFRALVEEALRVNPPPPFVPRRSTRPIRLVGAHIAPSDGDGDDDTIPANSLLVIAVGGGSWGVPDAVGAAHAAGHHARQTCRFEMGAAPSDTLHYPTYAGQARAACPFSKVFGGPPELQNAAHRAEYLHSCIGKNLAMFSINYTVRQLLLLPGLTQTLDPRSAQPLGLTKRAGFICERYPLEYEREKLLRQSPLQTVLPVKNPVPENAAALRAVLQFGAPFIEKVLRDARHVHFASFMFIDNDSKLVLFTAYDGDFDGYIGHFAHEFGPLFDRFFAHIEGGPPAPIAEHAFEFVQFLRRFQQPAVGGLFFSAYPEAQVDQITWQFNADRKYDFFTLEGGR